MELSFVGACHEVTGSCHYLKCGNTNILVDCGMEQGRDIFVNKPLPVDPEKIDLVFLTHAHIDHSGMLPKLYHDGFRGRIVTTEGTAGLSDILLRDTAHIQAQEAAYRAKKAQKRGERGSAAPLFTMEDTLNVLKLFETCPYDEPVQVTENVTALFTDVGHLLGSASIRLTLTEGKKSVEILFSGDIGNTNQPFLRDPKGSDHADYVVMESTYGTREHEEHREDPVQFLADTIRDTFERGGNLLIPAFAVGRTQVMLYYIRKIRERNLLPEYPDFPVYVDSPLAVSAIGVFEDHEKSCYDEEALSYLRRGINPLSFPGLQLCVTAEESMRLNTDPVPKVIISAAGMCDAGRIRHHLKYNLGRMESTVLFVGYQSAGTLGRLLVDGADEVKIFGEPYPVLAKIVTMHGMSGHADRAGLIRWLECLREKPRRVFVVHGEETSAEGFAGELKTLGYEAYAPYSGTRFDLLQDRFLWIAKPERIRKEEDERREESREKKPGRFGKDRREGPGSRSAYDKLLRALDRLTELASGARGFANKDLEALTKAVNDLCRRFERD